MNKIVMLGLATAVALTSGCKGQPQQAETVAQTAERVERVEATVLKETEIARQLELSTTLNAYETMNVAPSLTGLIEHIYVKEGDQVKQGDMLVRMDQNQFTNTQLAFANLETEMQRTKALYESGALSQQTYDQVRLSYDQTQKSLNFLETNTFVKAPFAGVIASKNYEDGELYGGQPILTLIDIAKLKAILNVPETYFPMIKEGMTLQLHSDIYPNRTFDAKVETVFPTVDANTHTFQVRIVLNNNANLLRPGMFVRTTMAIGKSNAIVVPYQGVLKLLGSNERYIFVEREGVAKRIFVELGERYDDRIEIISDELVPGDRMITTGQARLIDGVKLNLVNVVE